MEREEILKIANEKMFTEVSGVTVLSEEGILAFANAIAAHEREACVDTIYAVMEGKQQHGYNTVAELVETIRARGNK